MDWAYDFDIDSKNLEIQINTVIKHLDIEKSKIVFIEHHPAMLLMLTLPVHLGAEIPNIHIRWCG